jgi:4-hydroxy-tetrahydrodipicolinate reductase
MRLLNAIPAVCEAPPGLLSTLDLPLVAGRHLMTGTG